MAKIESCIDALGQEVRAGDFVAFSPPNQSGVAIAEVIRITAKSVSLPNQSSWQRRSTVSRPQSDIIKVDAELVTIAKMTGHGHKIWSNTTL